MRATVQCSTGCLADIGHFDCHVTTLSFKMADNMFLLMKQTSDAISAGNSVHHGSKEMQKIVNFLDYQSHLHVCNRLAVPMLIYKPPCHCCS